MSTVGSSQITNCDLEYGFDKMLISMGNSYVLKKRFALGEGYSKDDFQTANRLKNIIDKTYCDINSSKLSKAKEKLNNIIKKYT